jgi:GntR family transcriptional regulator/MocR family aminotransferase
MGQTLGLRIDPKNRDPIYRQIFDAVVERIESRAFPPGFRLPPSRALAHELNAHRNTVARAYADLEAAGFVTSAVGRGTFVEAQKPRLGLGDGARDGLRGRKATADAEGDRFAKPIPWGALLSRSIENENLGRVDRYNRNAESRDVINFARMQPSKDLLPIDLFRRAIDHVLATENVRALSYTPPQGVFSLREEIASDLMARGVPTTADDVIVTAGSQQAIDLVARALVEPGQSVLMEGTTYSGAIDLFSLAGARIVPVPSDREGPELSAIERQVRPDTKALYLMPNGHNPTGAAISAARRHDLVALSRATGVPLIEDDYAAGLNLDGAEDLPYLRALDADVIHISTFSKRLLPGLRLGFVVAPSALIKPLVRMKRIMDLGATGLMQYALAEFMARGYLRAHMRRIVPEYRARRDTMAEGLARIAGLPFEVPSHGVVFWLPLPRDLDPEQVTERAREEGVLVLPSAVWSVGAASSWGIRLTFCAEPRDRIEEGVRRLTRAIRKMNGSREESKFASWV